MQVIVLDRPKVLAPLLRVVFKIKKAKPVFDSWMTEQLADCSSDEAKIIKETVVSLKKSLRKVYGKSSKYRYD